MVPGALRVSPARPTTSTSGAGDLRGASVVRPAATVADGEVGHWRIRGRKWFSGQAGRQSPVLRLWSTWKGVGHALFIAVSGTVLVAGCSR